VNAGIDDYLRTHGAASITDLVGGIEIGKTANQAAAG
jgi:hypothetical protein